MIIFRDDDPPERIRTRGMVIKRGDYVLGPSLSGICWVEEVGGGTLLVRSPIDQTEHRNHHRHHVDFEYVKVVIPPEELLSTFTNLYGYRAGMAMTYYHIQSSHMGTDGELRFGVTRTRDHRRDEQRASNLLPVQSTAYYTLLEQNNFQAGVCMRAEGCASCSGVFIPEGRSTADICGRCARRSHQDCRNCGERTPVANMRDRHCMGCWDNLYAICAHEDCEQRVRRNATNTVYYNGEDGFACQDHRGDMQIIKAWNYKQRTYPYFGKGELFFGVEWEVENRSGKNREIIARDLAKEMEGIKGAEKLIFFKHDGSIQDGFEIVSNPFSWEFFKSRQDAFKPIYDLANKDMGSDQYDTCGFHAHLSRHSFTNLHLYKFMSFCYTQPEQMATIAERLSGRYASLNRPQQGLARKAMGDVCDGKYVAINNSNHQTVELRIFKGSLQPERFKKNLEFSHALWRYSRAMSISKMSIEPFMEWVARHQKTYRNLYKFLLANEKILIKPNKKQPRRRSA